MSKTLKDEQQIVDTLKSQFGEKILEAEVLRERRIHVKVADPDQLEIFSFAMEKWKAWHLIAMSSLDKPDGVIAADRLRNSLTFGISQIEFSQFSTIPYRIWQMCYSGTI